MNHFPYSFAWRRPHVIVHAHGLNSFIGEGEPVDALDAECKKWHQCRACVHIDIEGCKPNDSASSVSYFQGLGFDYSLTTDCVTPEATNYCTYNDSHPYMLRNCECDEQLAKTLARYYESKDFSTQYVTNLDGTGFDHTNRCVASSKDVGAGLDQSENVVGMPLGLSSWTIECCGSYPHRVPYKNNMNSCCANRDLVPFGAC